MAGGVEAAREQKFIETVEKKAADKKAEEQKDAKATPAAAAKALDSKADSEKGARPEDAKAQAPKPAPKKEEKKREIIMERIYNIPLSDAYGKPAMKRSNKAILLLREYLQRHMKAADVNLKISLALNNAVRGPSSARPMKKVKVKATKDKQGMVLAELAS